MNMQEKHDEPHCSVCERILPRGTDDYRHARVLTVFATPGQPSETHLVCVNCQDDLSREEEDLGAWRQLNEIYRETTGYSYTQLLTVAIINTAAWIGLGYWLGRRRCK